MCNRQISRYQQGIPLTRLLIISLLSVSINTQKPRQNGRNFANDICKGVFSNENCCILIKISLKFIHRLPISNIQPLFQIMAWMNVIWNNISIPNVEGYTLHWACDYIAILGLKLSHVSKMGPGDSEREGEGDMWRRRTKTTTMVMVMVIMMI